MHTSSYYQMFRVIWDTMHLDQKAGYICEFPQKNVGCITEEDLGGNYDGTLDRDMHGFKCLDWDTPSDENPDERLFETLGLTEDDDVNQLQWAHNYCRNPGGEDHSPFCFINTPNGTDYDYCEVPKCRERQVKDRNIMRTLRR